MIYELRKQISFVSCENAVLRLSVLQVPALPYLRNKFHSNYSLYTHLFPTSFLDCCTPEDGTDKLSLNVDNYQQTLCNVPVKASGMS